MFIENYTKFLKYYGKGRKLRITGFFFLSLIAGLLEFVGIALIYPFIMLIIKPDSIVNTKYYSNFTNFTHINDVLTNAFIIGFLVVLLFIAKNVFMIFCTALQSKFTNNWKLDINKQFMQYYMFSSYKNTLKTSPAEKIYNLTSLTPQALDGFIFRGINLVTNSIIIMMILALLFIKFPVATIFTSVFAVFSMIIQNKFFKKRTVELSKQLWKTSVLCNNQTIESLNNLKELKILSAEEYFYDSYIKTQSENNKLLIKSTLYGATPPYIIEILIVLALLVLTILISAQNLQNTSNIVVAYAVIVAAIFRIAPALNRIQSAINGMNSSRDFVKAINKEYEKTDFEYVPEKSDLKFDFSKHLTLKNINFSYDGVKNVIKDLNLDINKGEFIGIIGLSGAGKSTLADIIMGLLPVDSGEIFIDDKELEQKDFSAIRKLIGYVPQQINVLDTTFKENIAWGTDKENIDDEKVIDVLKKAQLYEFVSGFKDGINAKAIVGPNGLSQGQKQRLAIARALYRDPEIIIFDEATSSLDVETEHEITKMLNKFKGIKTIIAIAHRLSTLKTCDRLVYLKDGQVVDIGTFKQLSKKHAEFEKFIKLSNLNNE